MRSSSSDGGSVVFISAAVRIAIDAVDIVIYIHRMPIERVAFVWISVCLIKAESLK